MIRIATLVLILRTYYVFSMGTIVKSRFVVKKNERDLALPEVVVYTTNIIGCAAACQSIEGCRAANYLAAESTCYLLSKTCYTLEIANGWSVLTIRQPEREFLYISDRKETWYGAKTYCESIEGKLASITKPSDINNAISSVTPIPDPASVWLDGSDEGNEGQWYWSNGCLFNDQDFNFWGPNQPNNYDDNQNCLAIYNFEEGFAWDDDDCALNYNFICERFIQ